MALPVAGVAPDPASDAAPRVPAVIEQPAPPALADGCDPSYPGVCIPPFPPDLDCGEIAFGGFHVVATDPHGFDGDGDGVGCE